MGTTVNPLVLVQVWITDFMKKSVVVQWFDRTSKPLVCDKNEVVFKSKNEGVSVCKVVLISE